MTVEEAMDMESDDESDVDSGGDDEGEGEEARVQEKVGLLSMGPPDRPTVCLEDRIDKEMDVDAPPTFRTMEPPSPPLPMVGIILERH